MNLSFEYDRKFFPAFPVVEILVLGIDPGRNRLIRGLIDSGSDATQFPISLLRSVGARQIDKRWVQDLGGVRYRVPLYAVRFQLGELAMAVEAIGREGLDEIIIGRDILNQLIVTMNGLAFITEISD